LRAREHPTVSTHVTWDEVERCLKKKDGTLLVFESSQTISRFEKMGDLYEPVLRLKQKLPDLQAATASAAVERKPVELAAQADDGRLPKRASRKQAVKKALARRKRSTV
jgi:bifunctional non-homologous end joining protein LigD